VAVVLAHEVVGTEERHAYPVALESTPCNFGGRRWWFRCPAVIEGQRCQRRCRILNRPYGSYFACGECHQLTYRSRRWHRDRIYEGFVRPGELNREMIRRPTSTLSTKQLLRRKRQLESGIAGMERIIGSGEDA
jgi:hypothetical protein